MVSDVFTLISENLEGGTLHLPSVFDYQENFDEFAGIISAAKKKGVTLVFDNEGEIFYPAANSDSTMENMRLAAWAGYFALNAKHAQHYMNWLVEKEKITQNR